jgi:hypothetical protein
MAGTSEKSDFGDCQAVRGGRFATTEKLNVRNQKTE